MESLPGVGQLFQQLNGTVDLPQEENHSLPTPTPIPQDPAASWRNSRRRSGPRSSRSPCRTTWEATGDSFTVEDAWSDGIYLHSCAWPRACPTRHGSRRSSSSPR